VPPSGDEFTALRLPPGRNTDIFRAGLKRREINTRFGATTGGRSWKASGRGGVGVQGIGGNAGREKEIEPEFKADGVVGVPLAGERSISTEKLVEAPVKVKVEVDVELEKARKAAEAEAGGLFDFDDLDES